MNNFFKDSEVDKLLDKGRELTTYSERKKVYDDLQIMLAEKAGYIPLLSL